MKRPGHRPLVASLSGVLFVSATMLAGVGPLRAVNVAHQVVVNPNPADFTPNILSGRVNAIVQIGNKLIAGGNFSQVQAASGGSILTRTDLVAFDATTGAIDGSFTPSTNGTVDALVAAPDGNLLVGGSFTTVNGSSFSRLVKLNPTNGQIVQAFHPQPSARVRTIAVQGNTVYAGGEFTTIGGVSRPSLAAVDTVTGAVVTNFNLPVTDARKPGSTPHVYKLDISPDGTKMILIGNFTRINGLTRWQAGMINLASNPPSVADWQTDRFTPSCAINAFDTYMRDVDFSPDGSYFVVVTTGAYFSGTLCDTASRWPSNATGSGLQPEWVNYTGGDTLTSVGVTGTAVYVGGHQRWQNNPFAADAAGPGAVSRPGIAALDPVNGVPFSWNPGRDRGVGVFDIYSTAAGLWIGNDTDHVAGELHQRIAFFPVAGGKTIPPTTPYTLPGDLYNIPSVTGPIAFLTRRSFNGVTPGIPTNLSTPGIDWSATRGVFAVQGVLYYGTSSGAFVARTFDSATVGPAQSVDLHGLTNFPVQTLTGLAFTGGRIYYTVQGDARLYYRYFTPESRIVGAERWIVSGSGDGLDWSATRGLTIANGKLYFARTNGNLYSMTFANGAPAAGTEALVSPASAGYNWASNGLFVFSQSTQETTPPTTPGKPVGQSTVAGSITINWAASQDASPPIQYQVFRDGAGPVGTTTSTTFTDGSLVAGSIHTYSVVAVDAFGNVSQMSPASDPITVMSGSSAFFADDFASGGFANWTGVTRLTIDTSTGSVAAPSARAQVTANSAWAYKTLSSTRPAACMSMNVNATSLGGNQVVLLRLRTAANGAVSRVWVNASGVLGVRSDVSGTQISSGVQLGTGWHQIELCGSVGANTTWDLYRDGTRIVNAWAANTGTTPIGRIEIGDTAAKTFTINFDDVVVDGSFG